MSFRCSIATAAAVVGTAAGAQASLPARDTLAPAVVTATRIAAATATPLTTNTVVAGADIRAQGITRVVDALALVPGATILSNGPVGSQTSLFLRGGNSNYVRILVDGVPLNDAGGSIDLANLSTENVSRIEVVRGPASVLYGSDAVTGVIQLFTNDGSGPTGLRATAGGGSYGTMRGSLGWSAAARLASWSIGAARDATDGILPFNNRYTSDVLSGALRLAPDARTDVRVSARWSAAVFHYPTDFSGAIVDRNSEQIDHRFTAGLDAGRRVSERIEVRATLTSNEYLPRTNDAQDNAADTIGFYGYFARAVHTRRAADARINVRVGRRQTLTLGGEAAYDREASSALTLSQYGPSHDQFTADRHTDGLYAQIIGDWTDRISYTLGARRDDNSAFGVFTTARAAIGYAVKERLHLRASVGNAFKAPSFYENYSTGFVTGNPALAPEVSRSAEIGADIGLGDVSIGVAGYIQRFRDIVQYAAMAPTPGGPNYYNVAAANADGAEVTAAWRVTSALGASFAYAWTDTRVTASGFDTTAGASYSKGDRLIRRPPHTVSASLARTFGDGGVGRLVATRVGERADRDFTRYPVAPVTLPAYVKVDLSAVVPVGRAFALQFRADNVTDARFENVTGFPAPGATLFAGVVYRR